MDLDYHIQSLPVTGLFCRLRTFRPMGQYGRCSTWSRAKDTGLSHQKARLSLLIISFSIFLVAISPVAWAPAGEAYTFTISPSRLQESASSQVVLSLKVTNATTFTTYSFTWTVTDPSGSSRKVTNSTNTGFGTVFSLSSD